MVNRARLSKTCFVRLIWGHAGRDSFGNVFVIGQISVQNHLKIFTEVFRNQFPSNKGEARSDQSRMHLPATKHYRFSFAWVQQ